MDTRGTGCLKELMDHNRQSSELLKRAGEKAREWVESLAEDNLQKARERVEKAKDIMQNLTTLATSRRVRQVEPCRTASEISSSVRLGRGRWPVCAECVPEKHQVRPVRDEDSIGPEYVPDRR